MDRPDITIVIPALNEEKTIPYFIKETEKVRKSLGMEFEYLFIDDGSTDGTLEMLKKLSKASDTVHYISFSRNFGKEAAIYAGLSHAKGELVAIMDADLQDPPSLLPEMIRSIREDGVDCVGTRRVSRKGEPKIRSFFARCFYRLINRLSKTEVVDGARDYQLMNRKVVEAILSMGEYNRFSKGIFGWVGYKKKWLEYENVERVAGETKWSFWKLFAYAIDGIVAFSTAPLTFASLVGTLFCLVAFIMIIVIVIKTLAFGDPTSGWPSMVCILLLVSGVQLFCIGILGQYLAKTYLETKKRPIYLVAEQELGEETR